MVNTTISKALFLSAVAAVVAVTLVTAGEIPTILFQGQMEEAQQVSGDITAASGGNPFGGEKVGTVSIDSTGRRTNVSADINDSPGEGNVEPAEDPDPNAADSIAGFELPSPFGR